MTRILHVLQTPRAEGTPNLVLDWLAAGRGKLWQAVLVLNRTPADLNVRLRESADAYEEHELLVRRWRKYPDMTTVAYRAVRKYQPDVVICWTTGFGNWVSAGAFAGGCRRILVHAGNPAGHTLRERWLTRYMVWPMQAIRAKVICCSTYVNDSYSQVIWTGTRSFAVVPNCVKVSEFLSRCKAARWSTQSDMSSEQIGLIVANLEAARDFPTLLRAVPHVLVRFPKFRLQIVGRGSRLQELEAEVTLLGCSHHVDFLGPRLDIPELMSRANVFVFPTLKEGFGTVLLESLLARLPIVANDVPACQELLADGRWGTLVPPGNVEALADAVCMMLTEPPSESLLDAASAHAGEYTVERMIGGYLDTVGLRGGQ